MYTMLYVQIKLRQTNLCRKYWWVRITYWMTLVQGKITVQWPTFIFRSNLGSHWFIIPKYDVHTSNSLQDTRQNHWTVKYKSCWPSLHDPQVNVTRLSHVWPTICKCRFGMVQLIFKEKGLPQWDMHAVSSTTSDAIVWRFNLQIEKFLVL